MKLLNAETMSRLKEASEWHLAGDVEKAVVVYEALLSEYPDDYQILYLLGTARYQQDRFHEALPLLERSLSIKPEQSAALGNQALIYQCFQRIPEAFQSFRKAVECAPENPEIQFGLALLNLLVGNYSGGWVGYEWRQKISVTFSPELTPELQWRGEPIEGKVLLIHSEQGMGDTLQFCRYALLAEEAGASVILKVPKALHGLIAHSFRDRKMDVIPEELFPTHFDWHCPVVSLPLAFKTRVHNIPAYPAYLEAPADRVAAWGDRIGARQGWRVGLVWSGGFRPEQPETWWINRHRNITLAELAPLNVPGVTFYSLQKGPEPEAELADLIAKGWSGPPLIDYTADLTDYIETAALIANLDLVITVDTSVLHVAAAMGKPTWVLNRFDTCWRWFLGRSDSPWYPSVTLFRQVELGRWTGVVATLRERLENLETDPAFKRI